MILNVTVREMSSKIYRLILLGEIINGGNLAWLAKSLEVVSLQDWFVGQGIS